MYNLSVEGNHNFFVGQRGWLVHNQTRGVDCPTYSVAFEGKLPQGLYPGVSAPRHFQQMNEQLFNAFKADPAFAARMEAEFPGVILGVQPGKKGAFSRGSPTSDLTWHHEPNTPGLMQLVPRNQHAATGAVQRALHPNQQGGMEVWGGGRRK